MEYFKNISTVEEIKKHYKKLAIENHPDKGGSTEKMQDINNQYQDALKSCHGKKTGDKSYKYMKDVEQEIMDKLQQLIKLDGLKFALIGYWLWVTGETKKNKDTLKSNDLKWHSKRKCWYYKPRDWKNSRRSNSSLEELAGKYGYSEFTSKDNNKTHNIA